MYLRLVFNSRFSFKTCELKADDANLAACLTF